MADEGFGGSAGGVQAAIPLAAGRIGQQQGGSGLANNPLAFIGALNQLRQYQQQQQLFPGELELQRQGIQTGAMGIESNTIKLGQQKAAAASNYLRSLIGQENVSHDDVVRALGAAHGVAGVNTDNLVQQLAAYQPGPGGNYRGFVNQVVLPTMSESGALGAVTPQPQNVATGGEVRTGVTAPLMAGSAAPGTFRQTGSLGVSMTPDQLGQKVEWEDASGVKQQGTMAEWLRLHNQGAAIGQPSPVGGGPNPLLGPLAPGTNGQPDLAGRTGPIPGPRPGVVEAGKETGGSSAQRFQTIADQGVVSRQQAGLLGNIQAEVENYTPGAKADAIKDFKSILLRLNILNPEGVKSLAAQESVDKIANQLADALGVGSDARLHVQQGANPSSHNSPEGLKLIVNQLLGSADYVQARARLAAEYPDKGKIQNFENDIGSKLDPRVFQYDRLTSAQAQEYVKGIKDFPRFMRAHKWAEDHNLLASQQ